MRVIILLTDLLYAPYGIYKKFIHSLEPEMRDETKTVLLIALIFSLMLIGLVVVYG